MRQFAALLFASAGIFAAGAASNTTAQAEADLLKDIKVPEGFDATIFARPPLVNYPIFVSAAPDGTVYVGSDGNGSLSRDPNRGRVVRLRDTNGDGRADEAKDFATMDSPRGVAWDHDRLYVLHPPDISVFIDKDGDGVAEEKRTVVKGIGWDLKGRPADHASNGIEIGIDGWIYAAIGDFGFMEAIGTDGRKLRLRGGGIVRVRPDGTGLELYASGTRNILEGAVSPLLDIFARDNTNDGDGWDVRFHHFSGLTEHGYPSLYKNFPGDFIEPLADYGGGSGTGAAWIDEPGIPAQWNNAPFTCDWGRNWVYQHPVTPKGATFTAGQKEFFRATRVNDLDVDAQSRVFITSWKGASFNWAGPDVGYVVRLTPRGYTPAPLPNFSKASASELVQLLEPPSHRTRLEAQRTLLRRDSTQETLAALEALAANNAKPLASRVAAIFALKQAAGERSHHALVKLSSDPAIAAWAIRALTDRQEQFGSIPAEAVIAGTRSADARVRKEAAVALARLGRLEHAQALTPLLGDKDPVVKHAAVVAMTKLRASKVAFAVIDSAKTDAGERDGALRVLRSMHEADVVGGLIERVNKASDASLREGLLVALCRLYHVEGEWKGANWGTRPDTRGPYYQPEEWPESKRISDFLLARLNQASPAEARFLAYEFSRHRIKPGDAINKLVKLAQEDASLTPVLARHFAGQKEAAPASAVPLMIHLATNSSAAVTDRSQAVRSLAYVDTAEAHRAAVIAIGSLWDAKGQSGQDRSEAERARTSFLGNAKLDPQHAVYDELAARADGRAALFAECALLKIAGKKFGSPEGREAAAQSLQHGLSGGGTRAAQIMEAMRVTGDTSQASRLLPLLEGSDRELAKAARETLAKLKLDPAKLAPAKDATIEKLAVPAVIEAALRIKGDAKRGEQLFTQQGCNACHTVSASEALKGPYLGNIATIYQRRELAEAILIPSKSIAQGFAANRFELKDGDEMEGFVTVEAADKVSIRNIAGQEFTFTPSQIAKREKMEKSLMPEGLIAPLTVQDFASLLDYLESLAKQSAAK